MRISDWSSDVCSSDLALRSRIVSRRCRHSRRAEIAGRQACAQAAAGSADQQRASVRGARLVPRRSEEHTSELQSLMRISYAVFCLKKKTNQQINVSRDKSDQTIRSTTTYNTTTQC